LRVLVCGDRNWSDGALVLSTLSGLGPLSVVIHGACRGADLLGEAAARRLGVPVLPFPALWDVHGRAAGPIRNQRMLVEGRPDLVVAFHDHLSESRGTRDMLARARSAGVRVMVVTHP